MVASESESTGVRSNRIISLEIGPEPWVDRGKGTRRQRGNTLHDFSNRVEEPGRNHVVGKWRAVALGSGGTPWIIERKHIAVRIRDVAEITIPHRGRGLRSISDRLLALFQALPVDEPKSLILPLVEAGKPNRSTRPQAVLVADQFGLLGCNNLIGHRVDVQVLAPPGP